MSISCIYTVGSRYYKYDLSPLRYVIRHCVIYWQSIIMIVFYSFMSTQHVKYHFSIQLHVFMSSCQSVTPKNSWSKYEFSIVSFISLRFTVRLFFFPFPFGVSVFFFFSKASCLIIVLSLCTKVP